MKYILLFLIFSGPTSPNEIRYGGTYTTYKECKDEAEKSYNSWVCVPIEK